MGQAKRDDVLVKGTEKIDEGDQTDFKYQQPGYLLFKHRRVAFQAGTDGVTRSETCHRIGHYPVARNLKFAKTRLGERCLTLSRYLAYHPTSSESRFYK